MKSVLISIQPKWCEKIANGEKTIEVRKTRPKIETPFKCYIYETQGQVKALFSYNEWIYQNRMKVIGEFVCDWITKITPNCDIKGYVNQYIHGYPAILGDDCLSFQEMKAYLGNKNGYSWHISELKIYDKPKELGEFIKYMDCKNTYDCCACHNWSRLDLKCIAMNNEVKRPPQSWCYVEELAEEIIEGEE